MSPCIVLVRRFIRPEQADAFVRRFHELAPVTARGFQDKTLTRLDVDPERSPALRGFEIAGDPDCVTFLIVERWDSAADFAAYVPHATTTDQDAFELRPRQRVILSVV